MPSLVLHDVRTTGLALPGWLFYCGRYYHFLTCTIDLLRRSLCPQVYLGVYLQSHPRVEEEAVVMSMSGKAFTVHVPRLGITCVIFLDKIPDVVAKFDEVERTLDLQATSTVTHQWTTATIRILSKVVTRCVVSTGGGVFVTQLEFLRPKC